MNATAEIQWRALACAFYDLGILSTCQRRRDAQSLLLIGCQSRAHVVDDASDDQTAPLQVIVDATNSNTALIASGYINQIALRFAKGYQQDRINRISPQLTERIPSVKLEQRPWYNPDLQSRWFFVPGIVGSLTRN
jgi:hypothetical protein